MVCSEVLEAVRLGEESPDIYDHLAFCDSCRNKVENTQFVHGKDDPTDKRAPAPIRQRRRMRLTLVAIIAGVTLPILIIGSVAIVVLRKKPAAPLALAIEPSAPTVTPVAVPLPAPAAAPVPTLRRLAIDSVPPGALFIDGKRLGDTPLSAQVAPGRLLVEVRAEGFRTIHKVITVGDEDPKPLAFTLQPKGAGEPHEPALPPDPTPAPKPKAQPVVVAKQDPPEEEEEPKPLPNPVRKVKEEDDGEEGGSALGMSGFGFLTISTDPKFAKVFVDGKDTGRTTPVSRLTTPVGKHKIELRGRTGSVTVEVTVGPRKEITIDKDLE